MRVGWVFSATFDQYVAILLPLQWRICSTSDFSPACEFDIGCVVLFIGELHRCTELLFYSPVDVTETVVKFISLSPVTHRFNQAQPFGVLKKVNKVTHPPSAWQTTDVFFFIEIIVEV